jgi:transposase
VEVLLAAAAHPALAPAADSPAAAASGPLPPPRPPAAPRAAGADLVRALLPDPTLTDLLDVVLADDDLPRLLRLLPGADLYLQDEVDLALLPTLTRVWCRKGRRGQRHVETPGTNAKQYGFGLVDWRDGWLDWALAPSRSAAPFCDQLRRAVARSRGRGRVALVLCDNLSIHTPAGSTRLRTLLADAGDDLVLVHTPRYDPDSARIEWLWRALRRAVTHCHARRTLPPLLEDATTWATTLPPAAVLAHIGSPFAPASAPPRARRPRRRERSRPRPRLVHHQAVAPLPHAA